MREFNQEGGKRPMFQAICAQCGKTCEVPFRPTEGRQIFCNQCFEARKNGGRPNNFRNAQRGGDDGKTHNEIRRQLDAINSKIDHIISLIEPSKKEAKKEMGGGDKKANKPAKAPMTKKSAKKPAKKKKK